MRASDLMTPSPAFLRPETLLGAALETMAEFGIRHLPVLQDGQLVGVLSDRDLRGWLSAVDPETAQGMARNAPVSAAMSRDPVFVPPDADEVEVLDLALHWRAGSIPVVEAGQLVGIVTWVDLLRSSRERLAGDDVD